MNLQRRLVELRAASERLPRVPLTHEPTALDHCPRLSDALGGIDLWIKRDDCTGLAFGGNKTRQLEYTIGDAVDQGADVIVQGSSSQSNHCRQAAAACAKLGLDCHLVLTRDEKSDPVQGNLLLDYIFGATVEMVDAQLGPTLEAAKQAAGQRLREQGRNPYVIGGKRGKVRSAAGLFRGTVELIGQLDERGIEPDYLYVCSAGATMCGIVLAARAAGKTFPVQAIAPIRWGFDVPQQFAEVTTELAGELGLELSFSPSDIRFTEDYVGPAYGQLTPEGKAAIELVARTEGILLDPSYTAKAVAGLIDHVRRGLIEPGSTVVYVHTGGLPALFAYADELLA